MFVFQIEYTKDAEKTKHDYNLPHDAPQFVKAKEVAENISDVSDQTVYVGCDICVVRLHPFFQHHGLGSMLFFNQYINILFTLTILFFQEKKKP